MGAKHGLDPDVLSEIMLASFGRNWSPEVYSPWPDVMKGSPASNGYKPGFMVDLMAKNLGLSIDVADSAGFDNRMGQLPRTLQEAHRADGDGARDFSSVLEALPRLIDTA